MTEENSKTSFWHTVGKKYPAPTICLLLTTIAFLLGILGLGLESFGKNALTELAELRGLHNTIIRIDTTVAEVKERQDRTDTAVSRLIQMVMEQKRR